MKLSKTFLIGSFGIPVFCFELQHILKNDDKYSCPISLPNSCMNKTEVKDSCCYEFPGGIMLQTQFWDYIAPDGVTDPEEIVRHLGPLDSFTNHGLWPDNCDGSYAQFCNRNYDIDDVWHLLNEDEFNNDDLPVPGRSLLASMDSYWKSNTGDDESLWIHEFNKHGTCIKTISSDCYKRWGVVTDPKKQAVYDYFRIAMNLFKKKNTYEMLKTAGIEPSVDKFYTRSEISEALKNGHNGEEVHFSCDRHGALNEVWYFHSLKGSLLGEQFIPIGALKTNTNCPESKIAFYPKGHKPSSYRPPNRPHQGIRGKVRIGNGDGFLIKNGHWYSKGTPATYFLIEAPFGNFHLKTRMGYCGINNSNGIFACNKNVAQAAQFEYDPKKGYLGYNGVYDWNAQKHPRGNQQVPIYTGHSDDGINFQLKFVRG
ncbi:ribonuclease T2-like [Kluyveromyces marxianus]|uniref:ribonuclease T2 n=1 Tax=Kluyveromyces marxianus TaxID=4911 RepID=A0ABX6ERW7_KLUMA|nr:ribonuclease T2-like [Kluyveromyces marxianus]